MNNRFASSHSIGKPLHRPSETPGATPPRSAIRQGAGQSIRLSEEFIGKNPLLCLATGFLAGMVLGWWIKRT